MKSVFMFLCFFVSSLSSKAIYPPSGTVWKVGQPVEVKFSGGQLGETVNLFFNEDRGESLGGGPIPSDGASFYFIVPQAALSPEGKTSDLIAVHRINRRLSFVDSVPIKVVL